MVLNYIIRYAYKTITGGFPKRFSPFMAAFRLLKVCAHAPEWSLMAHNLKIVDIYNQVSL